MGDGDIQTGEEEEEEEKGGEYGEEAEGRDARETEAEGCLKRALGWT